MGKLSLGGKGRKEDTASPPNSMEKDEPNSKVTKKVLVTRCGESFSRSGKDVYSSSTYIVHCLTVMNLMLSYLRALICPKSKAEIGSKLLNVSSIVFLDNT